MEKSLDEVREQQVRDMGPQLRPVYSASARRRLTITPLRRYDCRHGKDEERIGEAGVKGNKKTGGTPTETGIES